MSTLGFLIDTTFPVMTLLVREPVCVHEDAVLQML